MIQNLGSEVRKISHNLVPESFDFGLARSLEELKEELLKTPGLSVELTYPTPCFETFTPSENLTIYRIIQEIIANILKHSQASKLSILIYDHKLFHTLAISDNGIGFDTKLSKKSIGLGWKNIEARLQMVNGSFKIQSILNKGTTVTLLIPTKK